MLKIMKNKVMKRICFFLLMLCVSSFCFAQGDTSAKQVSKIKQSKQYLWAESTDASEDKAYKIAKEELDKRVEEYIANSKKMDGAKNIVVQNIEASTSRVNLVRGVLHRVFIYVKKNDIVKVMGGVDLYEVSDNETSATAQNNSEDTKFDSTTEEHTSPDTSVANNASIENVESSDNSDNIEELFEDMDENAVMNKTTFTDNNYLASLPEGRRTVIMSVLRATSIDEVVALLQKQIELRNVKNFGYSSSCKNTDRCYWVSMASGKIVIFSPVKTSGNRINVSTGQVETLPFNISNMIWFAM